MTTTNDRRPATAAQMSYANSLAQQAGYTSAQSARWEWEGKKPYGKLYRGQMSELIDWLKAQI